ncbi:hypothetical protein DM01DRAFT_326443 [Hesseltinella vesiculosa]|uniref:Uncharacterized protein n=1 Tax=Hesseltinella vesiculosa TaxID=101127 RepID=A0A1X2GJ74_9FUNG|nr:hypothetical protein DM01DRAFT_326443 [Hesseltinella vesiculosa]
MNIDNNALTRRNPRHCRGCRFPCQQVVLNSRLIGSGEMTLQEWWETLLLVVPPINGLAHVRQVGDYLSVHFLSPQSAHSFITNPARWHTLMSMPSLTTSKRAIWHKTATSVAATKAEPTLHHGAIPSAASAGQTAVPATVPTVPPPPTQLGRGVSNLSAKSVEI